MGAGQPAADRKNVDGGIAGATTSRQQGGAVLACWCDNKSAAGRTTVLAHWREDESAVGRTMVLARLCVGDASSKCKEAGGAQDRIIHVDLVMALFLARPGKGGGGEGLPCRFLSNDGIDYEGTQQMEGVCSSWRGGRSI